MYYTLGRKSKIIFSDNSPELWLTELIKRKRTYGVIHSHLSLALLSRYCVNHRTSENLDTLQIRLIFKGIRRGWATPGKMAVANTSHLQRLVSISKKILNLKIPFNANGIKQINLNFQRFKHSLNL